MKEFERRVKGLESCGSFSADEGVRWLLGTEWILGSDPVGKTSYVVLRRCLALLLVLIGFIYALAFISAGNFTAFLYFRF